MEFEEVEEEEEADEEEEALEGKFRVARSGLALVGPWANMNGNSLRSFNSWAKKIHPPLPRTTRESQQLLNLLTSSFRRHLDNEHPPVREEADKEINASSSLSSSSASSYPNGKDTDNVSSLLRSAPEQHLNSILQHPLFTTIPSKISRLQPDHATSTARNGGNSNNIKPPFMLDALDDAMASGRADARFLHSYLQSHRASMRSLSNAAAKAVMQKSKVGSKVITWFFAADPDTVKQFFANRHTMALVMPYLAAEGRQANVATWLDTFANKRTSSNSKSSDSNSFSEFNVIYEYVAAEINFGQGINSALEFFLKTGRASQRLGSYAFRPTACYLAQWISSPDHSLDTKIIPTETYDEFLAVCMQVPDDYWAAILALYHPTQPNPRPALKHIKHYWNTRTEQQQKQPLRPDHSARVLRLCLESASLCLQQELYSEANWLVNIAKEILPATSTSTSSSQNQPREDDAPSNILGASLFPALT
ncbi:hypothetical protein FQN57_002429 [Myotisia sp. PD_48]|nr:hypothetical protein FQN57_002429 [Myotisia sp. PD_48]